MIKSDLLYSEEVARQLKKIRKIKSYLIYAANGHIQKNDAQALIYLKNLNDLEMHLKCLLDNLEAELITFDNFKATGIREEEN